MPASSLVISPHLDDAVLSCGEWMSRHPGATVVTLFAGVPPGEVPLQDWDRRCGFRSGTEAVRARRLEDFRALTLLGARPVWLDFLDDQYGQPVDPSWIGQALLPLLRQHRPERTLIPLGLFHSDHCLAHRAVATAVRTLGWSRLRLYEDAPYNDDPDRVRARVTELVGVGWVATPARPPLESDAAGEGAGGIGAAWAGGLKRRAIHAYRSQLRGFGSDDLATHLRPERFWMLSPDRADARSSPQVG